MDQNLQNLQAAVETVIKGKSDVVRQCLVALLANGHLLIEDVPGVGKTTLAHSLARSFDCSFKRIQFTSDLLPSDILGISVYNQSDGRFEFRRGPIFANVVLADEINRTTPKTQSALLEAMSEGKITLDNQTHTLPQPFMVIATQNPIEYHGTYPLPESQLDRFLMRIRVGYPEAADEKQIIRNMSDSHSVEDIGPVMSAAQVMDAQRLARQVFVEESLVEYLMAMVEATRRSEYLTIGISPRGSIALYKAAQAQAYLEGRSYGIPDDFKRLALPVFAHRVVVSSKYSSILKRSEEAEAIIRDILESVEVPL
ncbi:MAG: MoxR family ATPase [Acidobacteria bacterium]|nr:MoxR family ATPase [Acidobacteriota bacterium]